VADKGLRIGHGFDVHAFGPGQTLTLGGVRVPHSHTLIAHSDGDVVLHSLCDALLGAIGLGDIGKHFPDSDPRLAGVDSRILLRDVVKLLDTRHFQVVNVDLTVVAQAPKLAAHIDAMCTNIAADLCIARDCVNVKATTTEALGSIGRGQGIASHAVALVAHSAP
jgi:2-C-methyl-D-erythritol 2,4-cyclodiphosphate synthase